MMSDVREAVSFCRICLAGCGVVLTIDRDDRIVGVRGDRENPLTRGYACFKGLQPEASHHGRQRLLHPLKRMSDGSHVQIPSEQALDEIAEKIASIQQRHGNEALGAYVGNGGLSNVPGFYMATSFVKAMKTDQYFSTLTIDQSCKIVAAGRLGSWAAGYPALDDMDVLLLFGTNPLVSHGAIGFLQTDPVKALKRARARGIKLITVDPRQSETASFADIALQPFPGQDAAIAGGLIRLILSNGWEDKAFCEQWVDADNLANLRESVDPLTESYVERRAGLEPGSLRRVAELFARDSYIGCATAATGTSMAPFSNLAFHLIETLNVICGRYLREGQRVHQINGMGKTAPIRAQVQPPVRPWEAGGPSRIRGARRLAGERCTGTLADEILTPGEGQIKALLVHGGDPLTAWPDQQKTARALAEIDLLVCIDPWPSATTKLAHYVLPPRMQYERADLPMSAPILSFWPGAWAQYTPPIIPPPTGSDVVEDWYVYWSLAKRLGKTIVYNRKRALDMENPPTADELIEIILDGAPQTLADLKVNPHGSHGPISQAFVLPASEGASGQFEPMPADVADELLQFLADDSGPSQWRREGRSFTHLLASRRMRDMYCSNGKFVDSVRTRTPFNPAFLHSGEFTALGIRPGDKIEIASAHGRVTAIAEIDERVRPGVVSLAHGWGDLPGGDATIEETGTAVNGLIDADRHYEPVNAMPHMSAVPVNITVQGR